jgi:hypothetical protein
MMDQPNELERDVRALAEILIGRYGERAMSYASHQALKAKDRGEPRVMEAWRWIGTAVGEVLRTEPDWEGPAPRAPRPVAARPAPAQDGATRRIARLFAPEQAYES